MQAMSFFHPAKQVAFFTTAGKTNAAIITHTAGSSKRAEYPISLFEFLYLFSCLFNNAGEFMSHHRTVVQTGLPAMIYVKIRTADTRQRYFNYCISWIK